MSEKPISPLRQRMLEDMSLRGFTPDTQRDYIRAVKKLAAFLGRSPDTATAEDLRAFQLHLSATGVQPPTINAMVTVLRFFFKVTLDRPETTRHLVFVYEPRKLPRVLSPEEVLRLLEATPGPKHKAALSVAYGAGLRAMEVVALKVTDIDSKRMMLRVEQGKGRKDRFAMLSPQLLELLRDWWRIARPPVWMFPGRDRISPMTTRQLNRVCHMAAELASLPKWVAPHTLRHSFATHLLEQNIDIRVIQSCSKQRHTAHQHLIEGRIYYPFHPRCGEIVLIVRQYAYRGAELVVIPQPDGSVACIPTWMTHESAAHHQLRSEPRFSLDVLRSVRSEIDALLGFLQSDSRMEKAQNEAQKREQSAGPVRAEGAARLVVPLTEGTTGNTRRSPTARDRGGAGGRGRRR